MRIIVRKNPTISSENIKLSKDMREWQSKEDIRTRIRLLNFLQGERNHFYAMSMTGRTLGFSPDFVEEFKDDDFFIQRNPRFTKVSVTVGSVNELL